MYVGDFITKIRQRTGKIRYSVDASGNPTEGIPQSVVLDFINEAKDFLQAGIVSAGSTICDEMEEVAIVANTQTYQLVGPVHLGKKIRNIQYSLDGQVRNFRDLRQLRDEERAGYSASDPYGYILRGKKIDLVPIPSKSGGKFRCWFPRQWDDMNLRAGQITSHTTTQIILDNDSYLDPIALGSAVYFCTVKLDGTVKDYGIAVSSYNSGTRTITFPTTTLTCSDQDFVVVGQFATTHTDYLPTPLIQQYIKLEAQMRLFDQTSSIDAIRENKHLQTRYEAIIEGYEDEILDEVDIPVSDPYAFS